MDNTGHRLEFYTEAVRRRDLLKKAAARIKNLNIATAWTKWCDLIAEKRDKEARTNKWVALYI